MNLIIRFITLKCMMSTLLVFPQDNQNTFIPAKLITVDDDLEDEVKNIYSSASQTASQNYSGKPAKALKEIYKSRKEFFLTMLENGELIVSGELHDYVQSVLNKVGEAMHLTTSLKVYIVREDSPNAFNMGDNNVFIHLGLLYRMKFEDELAFVLAHELGHNENKHYDQRIIDYSELETNDSIKKQIRKINGLEYGRVSALNKLMTPWIISNKAKSRKAEEEADQFGYQSLKACGYNLNIAAGIFDILENGDHELDTTLFDIEKLLMLKSTDFDYTKPLRLKIESSLGTFEKKKDTLEDLLRTHPFGKDRKQTFVKQIKNEHYLTEASEIKTNFNHYRNLAEFEIIVNSIYTKQIDRAIFYLLQLYIKDDKNPLVKRLLPFSFAYLGYEKIKRRAGKRIETQSPFYDKSYNQLIYFLREISPDQCFAIAKNWNNTYEDFSKRELHNASNFIFDAIDKSHENFLIRYQIEIDRPNNYYIQPIINEIKTETVN